MKRINHKKYCFDLMCMKNIQNIKTIHTFLKPPNNSSNLSSYNCSLSPWQLPRP